MRKFSILLLALLCVVGLCVVPAFAEDAGGGDLPPDLEQDGGGEAVPDIEQEPEVPTDNKGRFWEWEFEDFKAFINETVIPLTIRALWAAAMIVLACIPLLKKIKVFLDDFGKAKKDMTSTAKESKKTKEETEKGMKRLQEQNDALQQEYKAMAKRVEGALLSMQNDVTKTMRAVDGRNEQIERMLIVAFCNNKELMDKGFARKIAQIGAGVAVDMDEIADVEQEGEHEQDGIEEAS